MGRYVKASKVCPNCEREYGPDYEFCTECGTKLPPVPMEVVKVHQCENSPDHSVNPEDKFCGKCGGRVIEVEKERPRMILVIGPDPKVIA